MKNRTEQSSTMYTEMHRPNILSSTKLDEYLARGWFRMGQMIFTCHFLYFDERLYSAVWLRLNIENFKFKKRHRKLLRNNQEQFRTVVQQIQLNAEKEELYQRYKVRLGGYVPASLKESLMDNSTRNIYNTYECCVYDGDKLIAASFFDIGSNSIASIKAIYDLEYSKHSLGFYTMLVEMQAGKMTNKQFYYPGYFVPGYEKFDYKLRIGNVDFYDFYTENWKSIDEFVKSELPYEKLKSKLDEMQAQLFKAGIHTILLSYPLYDKKYIGLSNRRSFHHPILLLCEFNDKSYVIEYNLRYEDFRLCLIHCNKELLLSPNWNLDERQIAFTCLEPLIRDKIIVHHKNPVEIILGLLACK